MKMAGTNCVKRWEWYFSILLYSIFLTVGENVAFGLRQHTDKSESEIQGIVDEMLELVGLPQSKRTISG